MKRPDKSQFPPPPARGETPPSEEGSMTFDDLTDALMDAVDVLRDMGYTDTAAKVDWAFQFVAANQDDIEEILDSPA